MTGTRYRQPEGIAEFADELRLLAEVLLERVEPALREAAAEGKPEWSNCTWCPLCAAAALLRGEQHEVLTAVAAHGTAIVTILREALAGAPVDPIVPHDHGRAHDHDPAAQPFSDEAPGVGDPDASGEDSIGPEGDDVAPESGTPDGHTDPGDTATRHPRADKSGKSRYVGIPVHIEP